MAGASQDNRYITVRVLAPEFKECSVCKEVLPKTAFYKSQSKSGRGYTCKKCKRLEGRARYRRIMRERMEEELERYIKLQQGGHVGECEYCHAPCKSDGKKCDKCSDIPSNMSRYCNRCFLRKHLSNFPWLGHLCIECNQKMRIEHNITPIVIPDEILKLTPYKELLFADAQAEYQNSVIKNVDDCEASWKAMHPDHRDKQWEPSFLA